LGAEFLLLRLRKQRIAGKNGGADLGPQLARTGLASAELSA
jgi:hypothetical protein